MVVTDQVTTALEFSVFLNLQWIPPGLFFLLSVSLSIDNSSKALTIRSVSVLLLCGWNSEQESVRRICLAP